MTSVELATATCADLPVANDWLSPRERAALAALTFEKRALDWRLGRWTAKAVARRLFPAAELEILAAADGAPILHVNGSPAGVPLSISHSNGAAIAVVTDQPIPLGCDLERIESRTTEFVASYFTAAERACLEGAADKERLILINAIWSAKESVLKATREGLRKDTRRVEIVLSRVQGWQPFRAVTEGIAYHGVWQAADDWVTTIVAGAAVTRS